MQIIEKYDRLIINIEYKDMHLLDIFENKMNALLNVNTYRKIEIDLINVQYLEYKQLQYIIYLHQKLSKKYIELKLINKSKIIEKSIKVYSDINNIILDNI